jgi:hypothetical protein
MLLSPERRDYSSIVLSVRDLGTMSACRHRVRHAEFGGVGEQGRVSLGLAWNTGDPSRMLEQSPDVGRHRQSTTQSPGGGSAGTRQEAHHQPTRLPCKHTKRAGGDTSGSLRLLIVALETWRSADGSEPLSSEGGVPITGTNAQRHGLNPPRK